ncbi:signal transduction histidine kinase [Kribbella kalugense]|uniref:histidine kinase n=2 Tax=Kribbella kalugense TaxID=2512221 RepID=A0A4R7ZR83_9ACTN|nr:HAMP domain-containing sensor histidine kinase [Kribbella kalugense]TDW19148.1 signal transduction histidine kinase [Kribbella kalugense]
MRRFFASVPVRAALGATLVVAIALVVTGVALLNLLRHDLADKANAEAAAAAYRAAWALQAGVDPSEVAKSDVPVQIEDDAGRVVAASKNVHQVPGPPPSKANGLRPAPAPPPGSKPPAAKNAEFVEDVRPQAGPPPPPPEYRWAAMATSAVNGKPVVVYVAAKLDTERSAITTVRWGMMIGLPPLLLLVFGMIWLVARRALKPVEAIRQEMASITASTDLARRVPVPASHDEIGRLARTTNQTLTALQESVGRQRRFVADASHELRNPIASLRTQLEVGAQYPALLDLDGAVNDTVRLQELAADLLLLARLDSGESPPGEPVDLSGLVHEMAPDASVTGDVWISGSESQLRQVVDNLLDNARRHARSAIQVTLTADNERAVLEVADDGYGVPEGERERIFERFVRLDDARTRDDGGAGLGLAIAREIAERHGGTLTAHDGALFRLTLPRDRS